MFWACQTIYSIQYHTVNAHAPRAGSPHQPIVREGFREQQALPERGQAAVGAAMSQASKLHLHMRVHTPVYISQEGKDLSLGPRCARPVSLRHHRILLIKADVGGSLDDTHHTSPHT